MSLRPILSKLWEDLRSNLWFLPALVVLAAILLALALIEVDLHVDRELYEDWPRLFGAGAEGSRGMLSAIASSIITVAGVAFSITVVALSLASSQYTSRVLRTFLRDRTNQVVLGILVGVFAYCIVVLRAIRGGDENGFVPAIAVLFAVLLAFVAIGALIYFIHHIATSIQVSHILWSISVQTSVCIEDLFPAKMGEEDESTDDEQYARFEDSLQWHSVASEHSGYIQRVDADALLEIAKEHQLIARMERGIGEFVIATTPLVSISGAEPPEEVIQRLNGAFVLSRFRTMDQDVGFGIRQIVDMALKALSPGVNDTTTGVMCIDHLASILVQLASRHIASPFRTGDGKLRVIARGPTFESAVSEAFDQIRQNADRNVAVLARLLQVLEVLSQERHNASRRECLLFQAEEVLEVVQRTIPSARDRAPLEDAAARLFLRLAEQGAVRRPTKEPASPHATQG